MRLCYKDRPRTWHIAKGMLITLALCCAAMMGFFAKTQAKAAENVPKVVKAQLASARDLEIYWDQEVVGGNLPSSFTVTVDGKEMAITDKDWIWDDETNSWVPGGIVCYNTRNSYYPDNPEQWKTSISLPKQIAAISSLPVGKLEVEGLPEIKVQIKENSVHNKSGAYVPQQTITVDTYEPFYQQEVRLECGVRVLGSKNVRKEAMDKAAEMLEVILADKELAARKIGRAHV